MIAKDFFGKELAVGDKVVYQQRNYRSFVVGYIFKITEKSKKMAKAKKYKPKKLRYTLRLTEDEARVILALVGSVGGSPEEFPFGRVIDGIYDVLVGVGIDHDISVTQDGKRATLRLKNF